MGVSTHTSHHCLETNTPSMTSNETKPMTSPAIRCRNYLPPDLAATSQTFTGRSVAFHDLLQSQLLLPEAGQQHARHATNISSSQGARVEAWEQQPRRRMLRVFARSSVEVQGAGQVHYME